MASEKKKLSNPFSTGGGGSHFEAHVQSSFVALMLSDGFAPCLPCWPIKEIKLQGKIDGFDIDDLIVFAENQQTGEQRRLLGQIKHSVAITIGSPVFEEVIQAAWADFNNHHVFTQGKDIIALITGPVNAIDQKNVQWLLDHAKHTKNSMEFFRDVEQANFSPSKSKEKLEVFRHHLKTANSGDDVTDDMVYCFFNHFHLLGYDLGKETGVILSLLHSHISQFQKQQPQWVWARIVDVVQTWNQHAGTVIRDKLPEDLLDVFKRKSKVEEIPKELKSAHKTEETDWLRHSDGGYLALAALIGSWNEKSDSDITVVCKLLDVDYKEWLSKARDILHASDTPLILNNGVWKVTRREELLELLGSSILDQNLDTFREIAEKVLNEEDPAFDLSPDERFAAGIHGKVPKYSGVLSQGVSEGLALLGSNSDFFTNCSFSKTDSVSLLTVRGVLGNASWKKWGSLNNILPNLAEAAPKEFLEQVENALLLKPCPFDELFAQEGNGLTGGNYLTGLLWALEGLAWDEQHFVRACCMLGELATHDPGGNWANRPSNSIVSILLPWLPQTLAPIEKRKVAIKSILGENPAIGWKLLLQLLPDQHQTSSGTHKPQWRKVIPEDWEKDVSHSEYWEQATLYAELAVKTAGKDFERVSELIKYFDHLPPTSFDEFIKSFSSQEISGLPEEKKKIIWDQLTIFVNKHRKFSNAKWALPEESLVEIEAVANTLAPEDLFNRYQYLFSGRDMDLFEEKGNWAEQHKKLEGRRETAIRELLAEKGLDVIIQFVNAVSSSREVGHTLGSIADYQIDISLLPRLLTTEDNKLKAFIGAYLWRRRHIKGWEWADNLITSEWTKEQLGQFLAYLPFEKDAWDRAQSWLQDNEIEYWSNTHANAYDAKEGLEEAVEKLIQYGRPRAAIECLEKIRADNQDINTDQCIQALLAGVNSDELSGTLDDYHFVELIKYLQSDSTVDQNDLFRVEWVYLPLLDGSNGAMPKLLENKLASDPDFFCEVIQLLYRSKKEENRQQETSETKKAIATNAWKLLRNWKIPPGIESNGDFNPTMFKAWLQKTKEICSTSGHLEVAYINVGEVLIYTPEDSEGLWINRTIANALNCKDAADLRTGYRTGTFNSRGVHWVDPTGAPEMELAAQFRQKAEAIEDAGFQRFATTLKGISDGYEREAERNIAEFRLENE